MSNSRFNAKNGITVGGVLGATPVPVIDSVGNFTPITIIAPGLYENAATITANYSISAGNNALSSGPVSIAPGGSVSVPVGSVWKII